MGEDMMFTTFNSIDSILKVTIPKEMYDKERDKIYKSIKAQASNYMVIVVPEGVELEIIN